MELPSPQRLSQGLREAAGTHAYNMAALHSQPGSGDGLETVVLSWLKEDLSVNKDFTDFVSGIREANPRLIERGLKRILFGLASYYDSAQDEEDRRENF